MLRQEGDLVQAMERFIAASKSGTDNYCLLGRVYSNMANMCRQAERHELAYAVYVLSAEQFAKANDSLAYAYALNNMAWEQAVQGEKSVALMFVDSSLRVCPCREVADKVIETRAAASLYTGEYDSTLYFTERMNSLYGRILRAQAFCLSGQCDSALGYAQQVILETDNPRYLDDAYYIITHCDSMAEVSDILGATSARSDVQREIEQNKTQMAHAILVMEQGLQKNSHPLMWTVFALVALLCIAVIAVFYRFSTKKHSRSDREKELMRTCLVLMQSDNLKQELHLNNYAVFYTTCNERMYNFANKLQQRGLSEREVRICVMVLIGLSYAQIADILNRAQNGIGKDKYVIAQKLGVTVRQLQKVLIKIACEDE